MRNSIVVQTILAMMLVASVSAVSAGPDSEGIKIHGHWEVIVADPDGTIIQHRRFENALTNFGKEGLSKILLGERTVARRAGGDPAWNIRVGTTGVANTAACREITLGFPPQTVGPANSNVVDSLFDKFTLVRQLQLDSACIPGPTYSISAVSTQVAYRNAPDPSEGGWFGFTAKLLDVPVSGISPSQVVTLRVTLSFE